MPAALAYLGPDLLRLAVWLVALAAIFVPLERRWALHARKALRRGWVADLAFFFVNGLLPPLLLSVPLTLLAAALHRAAPNAWYAAVAELPSGLRLAAALVVAEVGAYWGHRWAHQVPLLWRFHAVHHRAEEIDWLVNVHAHPLDLVFIRLCALLPLYGLGLAQPGGHAVDTVPLLVTVVGVGWGFFIHANLRWRLGPLEQCLSSPAFHHWHHALRDAKAPGCNFAPLLPWIDRCFGTFDLPRRQWPQCYGLEPAAAVKLTVPSPLPIAARL